MVLIFIHIPKNAGTSLHRVLEANYSAWETFSFRFPRAHSFDTFSRLSQNQKSKLVLIKGHWPFGLHANWPSEKVRYITMLRDPLKRMVSEYRYIKRTPHLPAHAVIQSRNLSLRDALHQGLLSTNGQARWLTGCTMVDEHHRHAVCAKEVLEVYRGAGGSFGLVDRFDESLLLFQAKFGWRSIWQVPTNVAPCSSQTADDITQADRDAAAEATTQDKLLLQIVEKQWTDDWVAFDQQFPGKLEDYRASNRARRRITQVQQALRYFWCRSVWRIRGRW